MERSGKLLLLLLFVVQSCAGATPKGANAPKAEFTETPTGPSAEAPAPGPNDGKPVSLPRLIILTESSSQVFSGTFKGQQATESEKNSTVGPPMQLEYAGPTTGIQVFAYNADAINSPLADLTQVQWSPFDDNENTTKEDATIAKGRAFCRQLLIENPKLKLCEPDQNVELHKASSFPSDPLLPQQWSLDSISLPGAWQRAALGSRDVRVCMVDTGLDYFHPDLAPNVWTNKLEIPDNGIDDDNNGIVDDIHGANFQKGFVSGDPYDDNGHGTFVAGVVGAVGNNKIGISGIAQEVSIIGCKFMDANGNGLISDAIRCYDYCAKQDAHIISNSWGVYSTSAALQQAATALDRRGIILTASSGNSAKNTDLVSHVPSTLTSENLMAVGALQQDGTTWPGSNIGLKSVDFMAPGARVLGLAPGGSYITMTGTSMANPHVAGVAAIVLAKFLAKGFKISTLYPSVGLAAQVKNTLILSSYKLPGDKVSLYGGLNATQAVQLVPDDNSNKFKRPKAESEGTSIESAGTGTEESQAMAEAPAPSPDSGAPGSCDCNCYLAPVAAPAATSNDLPPGYTISSSGTVINTQPEMAPPPMPSRKMMGPRPE